MKKKAIPKNGRSVTGVLSVLVMVPVLLTSLSGCGAKDSWKKPMKDAIDAKLKEYWEYNQDDTITDEAQYREESRFALLYINDDDIPEIYMIPASSITDGSSILYLKDGAVEEYDLDWSDSFDYIPRSGKILLYHGQHIPAQEYVLTFPSQEELGHGSYAETGWYDGTDHSVDGSGTEYMWNDEFVSEEEYQKQKEELFSGDIHNASKEETHSYEELLK